MKKYPKRDRQEGAIKRLEKTVALHEANAEFTKQIIEDHKESGSEKYMKFERNHTEEQIEKIRSKKIERAKTTIENTKEKMK